MSNPSKRLDMGKGYVRLKKVDDLALDLVGRTMRATLRSVDSKL